MEKITFLIPCFNEVEHTKKGVSSILANSPLDKINFLFIDNGSTDGTAEFLKTVPNARVIANRENIYVNPAWNQGFQYILDNDLGDYVCLCNNDIIAGERWVEPLYDLFRTRSCEFYVPTSNTQPAAPFQTVDEFRDYAKNAWAGPLVLSQIRELFMGFCIFMRKSHIRHFYPIPHEIKVLRGDDWIVDNLFYNCIMPVRVNRCTVHHFCGATQRGLPIHDIRNRDVAEFDRILRTTYRERGMGRIYEGIMRLPIL